MVNSMIEQEAPDQHRSNGLRVQIRSTRVPGVTRLLLWSPKLTVSSAVVAELIQRFGSGARVSLELLEQGAVDVLSQGHVRVESSADLGAPLAFDVSASDLLRMVPYLAPYPFTGWIGISSQELKSVVRESSDRKRETLMLPFSLYLIFSLYDDNIDLRAKGLTREDILDVVRRATENLGVVIME